MKQYTSKFLKSVAVIYMAFPVSYTVATTLLFDLPASSIGSVLLSPGMFFLSALAMTVGYGFWEMKRWGWYLFVLANSWVAYETIFIAHHYGASQHPALALIFSLIGLLLLTARVAREVRVPYFFPRIRWWESNPRYRLSVPVKVERKIGETIQAEILDLSLGGCFIKLRHELPQDERVLLSFSVFGILMKCEGFTVWRTQSTVTHPKGVGIKFGEMARADRRSLRTINARLKKIAQFYKKSRYLLNQDEFLRRLQELESPVVKVSHSHEKVS
ncbi:MAG: PilZ domain-containing protein [Oligoflexia bacterium]|nr:PilZ domain-containing protein [Oligoflexia bacterium]